MTNQIRSTTYVLTHSPNLATNELLSLGIRRHEIQSPSAKYLVVTSPDRLRGTPRGIKYVVIGAPSRDLLAAAWSRDGEEIELSEITKE